MTWNAADKDSLITLSGGDLTATRGTAADAYKSARGSIGRNTGKWYFEVYVSAGSAVVAGIATSDAAISTLIAGFTADSYGFAGGDGNIYHNSAAVSYEGGYGLGNLVQFAFDADTRKLWVGRDNVWSGDPGAGTGENIASVVAGTMFPALSLYSTGDAVSGKFAAADQVYSAPSGFAAWDSSSGASGLIDATTPGIAGSMAGESGVIGTAAGDLPSIAGDFPGGQGMFAALAGDVVGIAGDIAGLVAQSGEMAGDLPMIAGEFIGGYSVAGIAAGDLPSISGVFSGFTSVASTLDGTLPLIAGSFVGGMATVAAMAGDLPSIAGAFNDGPIGVISGGLSLASGDMPGHVGTAATGIWLYLHTTPPVQVYQIDALRGRLNQLLPQMRIPFEVSATAATLGAQNDSFRVRLDRPSDRLRGILSAQAPYGVRVDVMDGGTLSRTGIIDGVAADAGGDFELDCQSAGWTDDLPLRTNADLGIFRDVERLPWRYGRAVPGKCVRLGATGKRWMWADHASSRIASVTVDALPYDGWQWRNETDAEGNAITVIETVDALEEGADVVAVGDGAVDVLSGTLMTNPADIVGDLCRRGGITIDRGQFSAFRVECHARQIEIAGSIESGSLQSALVSIAESIYAAFSRSLPGLMRLRPRSAPTVTIRAADTPAGSASRDSIATRLRIRYALEDGKPRASMALRAPSVEALRGIVVAEVTLPWVSDARVAADVGGRILGDRARPRYSVRAARQLRRIVPGDVVTASVPSLNLSGPALVTASAIADRGSTPVLELAAGTAPATEILSSSIAYTPEQYTGATVTTQGNDRVIVITDNTGAPLAGAACLLDGSTTRFTDGAGKVALPLSLMPPGPHTIYVTASGFDPFTLAVVVP